MSAKHKNIGSEKDYLIALDEMLSEWIRTDMVKATATYVNWQHDKGSLAFGYVLGLKDVQHKLRDRRQILTKPLAHFLP